MFPIQDASHVPMCFAQLCLCIMSEYLMSFLDMEFCARMTRYNEYAFSMQNDCWLVLQTNKSVIRANKSMVGILMMEA